MYRNIVLIIILFGLFSCTEERPVEVPSARRTVLVYMSGDNNLSDETYTKIDSITAGWHNRQDNLLIYQDARGEKGTPSLMRVIANDTKPIQK